MLALLAVAACLQDDPFDTRVYNVEFVTAWIPDHPGEPLGLHGAITGGAAASSEVSAGRLSADDLIALIKTNVAEDSWDHVAAAIETGEGVLTVTNRRSILDRIGRYLDYWRGVLGRRVALDAHILDVDPLLFRRTRAAGNPDRPFTLSPEGLRALLDAARDGKSAAQVAALRLFARPGQRVALQDLSRHRYLADYDVQIGTAASAVDPVVAVLSFGTSVDVRPWIDPVGDRVTLEFRGDAVGPPTLEERTFRLHREVFAAAEGGRAGPVDLGMDVKIQLPQATHDGVRTTVTVRAGETAVVAAVLRDGRVRVFLATPAVVAFEENPAPEPAFEEQRLLRMFDVSPLTRSLPDFAGPTIDAPLYGTGAVGVAFGVDEPAVRTDAAAVAALLRSRVAPDSWNNTRNAISTPDPGTLMIRQKPEVLREIDRVLQGLLSSRAQMITTETAVIAIPRAARAEWEKEIPALGPGGLRVDPEAFGKLYEAAAQGRRARLLAQAETTGFPQQRVHARRLDTRAYLEDFEPQVSTHAFMDDPIIGSFMTGYVHDVQPHFVHGQEQIAVELRAALVEGHLADADMGRRAGLLQQARVKAHHWRGNIACLKGQWSLVGLKSVGQGEAAEDVALFLRARINVLK